MSTPYHAKYFAHELTRRSGNGLEQLRHSLFDAAVDLNPHQIEAALFALRSPLSKGVLLADEVGLGKTIEAGLVLCQFWAEKRRRLLVICPASLRKQWSLELSEKFNLPSVILDARSYAGTKKAGNAAPLDQPAIVTLSYQFARRVERELLGVPWDLAVIDEAHKLRGCYRTSNRIGQSLLTSLKQTRKLLLTATPLQNSLVELYGLSLLIDENIFGDAGTFRARYANKDGDHDDLRERLKTFCNRTLRSQVLEYVRYTQRRLITIPFTPNDNEQRLYDAVSKFLQRNGTYAIPDRQRELTTLVIRKLLASSSYAVTGTLETIRRRLEDLLLGVLKEESVAEQLLIAEEMADAYADEVESDLIDDGEATTEEPKPDPKVIREEINELEKLTTWAHSIQIDGKTRSLLIALRTGFEEMAKMSGAARKAVVFTESRRTQDYLKNFLEANGYARKIVLFNGSNGGPEEQAIFERWVEVNRPLGRLSGSLVADKRQAILEHFRDHAEILLATESAAEGVNLQFCSLIINYDLPWNPQRIEQRIGRCHRYGQKFDVVVINFLNSTNAADQRVFELLRDKFQLFTGVFGASDEVLGSIEDGVDFEKRILQIYQGCRTPEEIEEAFRQLRLEMDSTIQSRMESTRRALLEHFDEDVHARLRGHLADARAQLDRTSVLFWRLTRFILSECASFDDASLAFELPRPPFPGLRVGKYQLISKNRAANLPEVPQDFLYRLSHPLGEFVIEAGKKQETPIAEIVLNISQHPTRVALVEGLKGQSGVLVLARLVITSLGTEEYLLFSGFSEQGATLDQETCEKLFQCDGDVRPATIPVEALQKLGREADRHRDATISGSLERNNSFFREERDKLERWAEDAVEGAEKELRDTKAAITAQNRAARVAHTTEEQHAIQQKIAQLEREKRRQRQRIFEIEDEIIVKRDQLIGDLEKRLTQRTTYDVLYSIRWRVV
jgi:hypothetical protein